MKFKCLFLILLLSLLPFTASAIDTTDGSAVKKIGVDGKVISIGGEKSNDDNNNLTVKNTEVSSGVSQSKMEAGQTMLENAWWEIAWSTGDKLLEAGFKINSIGMDEKSVTGAKTFTYSVYSKEINPFNSKTVKSIFYPSLGFYAVCMIILGAFAYIVYCAQENAPKLVSKIRKGISGDEGIFDIEDVFSVWGTLIGGPVGTYAIINFSINARNLLVISMATGIVSTIANSSDSLPSYLLACISWYFSGIQRLIAFYGIHLFVSMFLILWIVVILIYLFASLEKAALVAGFSILEFVLCVLVDIIIVAIVWFGTQLIAETGIQEIGFVSMIIAFFVALGLLVILPVCLFIRIAGHGKIGIAGL